MVAQGVLPFTFEPPRHGSGLTALGGLPIYLDLASVVGLRESIDRNLGLGSSGQGWSDPQVVTSLVLLNLAGGDSVDDLRVLEGDRGFGKVLRRTEMTGMSRRERRALERRFRKARKRSVPSPSAAFRYLNGFCDAAAEAGRGAGSAFVPEPSAGLAGLRRVNADVIGFLHRRRPVEHATLDMDATLVETHKRDALHSYKAYQPLNVYWYEQGTVLHSEFRDGNVNAGFEQLRVLEESLAMLPEGVKAVSMRSDTAGYQWDLLRYCAEGKSERFGEIDFVVGADVTPELKRAAREVRRSEWTSIKCEGKETAVHEWAEICFVPNNASTKKDGPTYRFVAIRELLEQQEIEGMESQQTLPFPTAEFEGGAGGRLQYKLHAVVTNDTESGGEDIIRRYWGRCGRSEKEHAIMKDDLAGGVLPSKRFGANAAWWAIMILALNLNVVMRRLVLGGPWANRRMKAIRFHVIGVAARVIEHSRRLRVRLDRDHPATELLIAARLRIAELAHPPPPAPA